MANIVIDVISDDKFNLLKKPKSDHFVQFYRSDDKLLASLTEYIRSGLANGETCIVIATPSHIEKLNERLDNAGQDVLVAHINGNYMTYDASETLALFMVDGMPDRDLFFSILGDIVRQAAARGTPIRAYGEMVALLWKAGNKDAVIQLEQLWNELAERYSFSLYCAYPELHFIMDRASQDEISEYHNINYLDFTSE